MRTWILAGLAAAALSLSAIGSRSSRAFADAGANPHAPALERATRSTATYPLPDITLVRDDGATVSLAQELNDGRPVALNFVFTSCTGICPLMSRTFSQLQSDLARDRDSRVHLVSISIDPEQDTPERLREYGHKFGAGPGWQYYTGTREASIAAQRAFNVYRGDKMSHDPVTFLRAAPGTPWVRIDGFATGDELATELRQLLAANATRAPS